MRCLSSLILCLLVVCPAWGDADSLLAVNDERLVAQTAVIAAETAVLDSLISQGYAYGLQGLIDSTLEANNVSILVVSPHPVTGVRDNSGSVDVDIPYGVWSSTAQENWALRLDASGIDATPVSAGRYIVHQKDVPAFLALVKTTIPKEE